MEEKTFREWEEKLGVIVKQAQPKDLDEKTTEEGFRDYAKLLTGGGPGAGVGHGVHHEDRKKFLKDNGFPVNRETMVNNDLSAGHKVWHPEKQQFVDYDDFVKEKK